MANEVEVYIFYGCKVVSTTQASIEGERDTHVARQPVNPIAQMMMYHTKPTTDTTTSLASFADTSDGPSDANIQVGAGQNAAAATLS